VTLRHPRIQKHSKSVLWPNEVHAETAIFLKCVAPTPFF
jgi:hypothetical protein